MITKDLLKIVTNVFITAMIMASGNVNAQDDSSLQCIEAPKRDSPCPNLIYSSFHSSGGNVLFCLCKRDKAPLLELLKNGKSTNKMKLIRQLVSQQRLTKPELISLLQDVND